MVAQGGGHVRLIREHIERRAGYSATGNSATGNGMHQGGLIHHRATRHIDQVAVRTGRGKHLRIDQSARRRATGVMASRKSTCAASTCGD